MRQSRRLAIVKHRNYRTNFDGVLTDVLLIISYVLKAISKFSISPSLYRQH